MLTPSGKQLNLGLHPMPRAPFSYASVYPDIINSKYGGRWICEVLKIVG